MQINGIRLLRVMLREMGVPERKVRNAIRYLTNEKVCIVSAEAAEYAIKAESKLGDMYSAEDRPFLSNFLKWNPVSTRDEKISRIRAQWSDAQLRRLISDRRPHFSEIFYGYEVVSRISILPEDRSSVLLSTGGKLAPRICTNLRSISVRLENGNYVDYDWLCNWWTREYESTGFIDVSTYPLFHELIALIKRPRSHDCVD